MTLGVGWGWRQRAQQAHGPCADLLGLNLPCSRLLSQDLGAEWAFKVAHSWAFAMALQPTHVTPALCSGLSELWSLLILEPRWWQPQPPLSPQHCLSRLTTHSWVLFSAVNITIICQVPNGMAVCQGREGGI